MDSSIPENIDDQLDQVEQGSESALDQLLQLYRQKLHKMVAVRIDPQLSARVDPSDIVQEAVLDASRKMPEYLRDRPLPFYPWLRQIAWNRLIDHHRRHLQAEKRSVLREQSPEMPLPDQSSMSLVDHLACRGSSPSKRLVQEETRQRVRAALDKLPPATAKSWCCSTWNSYLPPRSPPCWKSAKRR